MTPMQDASPHRKATHAPNTGTLDLGITNNHTLSCPTSLRDVGHPGFRYGPPAPQQSIEAILRYSGIPRNTAALPRSF